MVLLHDFAYLETAMIEIDDSLTPSFQVQVRSFDGEEIAMNWYVASFDEEELKLQIIFARPELVSMTLPRDQLIITF